MHIADQVLSIVECDAWPRQAFGPETDRDDLVLSSMCVNDRKGREDDEYVFIVFLFEFGGVDGMKFWPCGGFD